MADLKVTQDIKDTIVDMLGYLPNMSAVCKLIGIHPATIHKHRKADEEFGKAVAEALEVGYDSLEAEAYRRAVDGVDEPIHYRGEEVGTVKRYSDSLLTTLLKANKPKKFNPGAKIDIGAGDEKVTFNFNIGKDD